MNTMCMSRIMPRGWPQWPGRLWRRSAAMATAGVFMLLALAAFSHPARSAELLAAPQLEQLVAPIALYPDPLLSQVLMAATYPLEVVEAERWRAAQPQHISDSQLSAAVQSQPWDPSVKSLTAFPDVLRMMSDKLDWTEQLGDAFLGQQNDVMDAVQRLRVRAQTAGHLQSSNRQRVVVDGSPPIIQIVPAQPDIVYVPVYNPLVVYGPWPYPAYRPIYWYPPAYAPPPGVFISFGAGLIVGNALWGHVDWRRHYVNINVDRYNRFNRTHISNSRWMHNVEHRRGLEYRNAEARQRFEHGASADMRARQREQFRSRANEGRGQLRDPGNRQAAQRAVEQQRAHGPSGYGSRSPAAGAPNVRPSAAGRPGPGGFGNGVDRAALRANRPGPSGSAASPGAGATRAAPDMRHGTPGQGPRAHSGSPGPGGFARPAGGNNAPAPGATPRRHAEPGQPGPGGFAPPRQREERRQPVVRQHEAPRSGGAGRQEGGGHRQPGPGGF